jgi:hypothetical protein
VNGHIRGFEMVLKKKGVGLFDEVGEPLSDDENNERGEDRGGPFGEAVSILCCLLRCATAGQRW